MKKILALYLACYFFSLANCAAQDSLGGMIKVINAQCAQIDKDIATFKEISTDISDMSSEGGELQKFYNGKNLEKAILTLYGETGQSTREFYFQNEQLIFIFQSKIIYKVPIYMGKIEVASQNDDKFYFISQILVRWIDNEGKTVDRIQNVQKQIDLLNFIDLIKQ